MHPASLPRSCPTQARLPRRRASRFGCLPSGWILLLILIIPLVTGCATRAYKKGNQAMLEGETRTAIRYYLKAVKAQPQNASWQFALGQAWLREGRYDRAIDALNLAAELAPERVEVLEQLAFAHAKAGHADEAIDVYWRILSFQKQVVATYEKIRPLLEEKGRYSEVVDAALLASRQPRFDSSRLTALGKDYLRAGRLKEAERLFVRSLEMSSSQPDLWRMVGELRLKLGNGPGAAEAFGKAYQQNPNDLASALGSAAALRRIGQIDQSLAIYERVVSGHPELSEPRVALIELYLATGRVEEAAQEAREAYVRTPEDPAVQALKGAVHLAQGEFEKAYRSLDLASRGGREPGSWVFRMQGEALVGLDELATARQRLTKALSLDSEDGAAHLGLCRLDLDDDREAQGMDHCQKAMTLQPELRDQAVALMQAWYEKQERMQKVIEVEAKAPPPPRMTRRNAGGETASAATPRAKVRLEDLKALREELQAIPEDARQPREWFELGDLAVKLDDLEQGEKCLTKAWQADQGNLQYHARLAGVLLARGKYDSALVHYKSIIREDEQNTAARFALARAYLGRGSAGDALEVLKELKELQPNDPRVYELLAEACLELGLESEGLKYAGMAKEKRGKRGG